MGGGLMQLVAYGAQDIYLTGNPQITFFKVVYRRHTNFSMEAIEQTLNGTVGASSRVSATVSRNGDLVGRMYLEHQIVATADANDDNYGTQMIDYVECEIGGQKIDKQYGHWMEAWLELTENNPTGNVHTMEAAGADATTNATKIQKLAAAGGVAGAAVEYDNLIFVPLQFWFCRNPGLALPLIALQYHEVKINIATSSVYDATGTLKLWADYFYLDTEERRRFAQVSHEYLIEQVQHQSEAAGSSFTLNFNHPVKELVWTGAYTNGAFASASLSTGSTWKLVLNGHDRMAARDYRYFTRGQVWQHHTGYGAVNNRDAIAVYSFALKPEEHQPSGTCNFSRIDNAQLKSSVATGAAVEIYAVNYNVLRVMSGMGGLAYSN
jgi:hypothetical protein